MDLPSLEFEYRAILPIAESFCKELSNQLTRLIEEAGIALGFPIQCQVKPWDRLAEKLARPSRRFKSIKDIQDLVGLRIILLFKRDVATVAELISEHLAVVRRYNAQEKSKEDPFGYSAVCFVVELPDTWLTLPTLAKMRGLKAEIKVRTVAQHLWAEASHALQYKQQDSVPPSVRHAVGRVSTLLETVDAEFERVLSERDAYRAFASIAGTVEVLNVDLLEKTLDSLLPPKNKDAGESYQELLEDLNQFGISTQRELRALIEKHLDQALASDEARAAEELDDLLATGEVTGTTPERTSAGIFFTHIGLAREILRLEFGEQFDKYIRGKFH